jgi:hypothetical protein
VKPQGKSIDLAGLKLESLCEIFNPRPSLRRVERCEFLLVNVGERFDLDFGLNLEAGGGGGGGGLCTGVGRLWVGGEEVADLTGDGERVEKREATEDLERRDWAEKIEVGDLGDSVYESSFSGISSVVSLNSGRFKVDGW